MVTGIHLLTNNGMFKLRLPTWEKGRMSSETGGLKGIPVGNTGQTIIFLYRS